MSDPSRVVTPFDVDRPNTFKNLVGNKTILGRITGMLANNRLSQVLFFTGPIGSGKTTTARIVARAKFCKGRKKGEYEPCGTCSMCMKCINDTTCGVAEYHEYGGGDVTEETLKDFGLMFQRPWEVIFIDELQDTKPDLLRKFRKMIEGVKATIIMATTHPGEIEEAVRSRLKSYEYLLTRPTIEEATEFLQAQFQQCRISFNSRQQLERVCEAYDCEMRPLAEFSRKVLSEANGKLTDEYLDELFGPLTPPSQEAAVSTRRRRLV